MIWAGSGGAGRPVRRSTRWSGAPSSRFAISLAIALTGLLALTAAPASAFITHPFTGNSFGPGGLGSGSFASVQSIALDQRDGDVYVDGGGSIYKFDGGGEPALFTNSATNVIEGVGASGNDENEIAIDSSNGPAAGDIYATFYGRGSVGIYAESGEHIGDLNNEGAVGQGEPCGVATDPAGNVYVALASGYVNKYTPSASPVTSLDYVSSLSGLNTFGPEVCNIAADSAGDVYVATFPAGPVTRYPAAQFSPTEEPATGVEVDPAGSTVAVDPASQDVYVNQGNQIAQYNSSAQPQRLGSFGASEPGAISGSFGVAVNGSVGTPASGDVYAASGGTGLVNIYGPVEVLASRIDSTSVTAVTSTSATLQAEANPLGTDTTLHFQYGTADCEAQPAACTSVPSPPGRDIGSGEADLSQSVRLSELAPSTTYHYRAVAVNSFGTVESTEHTFTTQSDQGPPALLDNRGWEMVSPLEKNSSLLTVGGQPGTTEGGVIQAAPDGNSFVYTSNGSFADPQAAPLSDEYLAERSQGGWSTRNLAQTQRSLGYGPVGEGGPYKAFSSDLATGLMLNGEPAFGGAIANPPLPGSGAPANYQDFYFLDNRTASIRSVLSEAPAEPATGFELTFEGTNPDLTRPVFRSQAALTPDATANGERNLYQWTEAGLRVLNLLPGDESTSTPGARLAGNIGGDAVGAHAISADGSRVYFGYGEVEQIYLREDNSHTIPVGTGHFLTASTDGSVAFYTSAGDLFEFNAATAQSTDLTPGGGVQGVLGASADGTYVYLVANGSLVNGAPQGNCHGASNPSPSRKCGLYLLHHVGAEWVPTLVATLSEEDDLERFGAASDWSSSLYRRTSRVSADGRQLVFMSDSELTGYNNHVASGESCGTLGERALPATCQEVYDYEASASAGPGHLDCVSCNPTGARPVGPSAIPGGTPFKNQQAVYQSRVGSRPLDTGNRVFFDSSDALLPQDTNGVEDVYEWESDGTGSCAKPGGCLGLISSGTAAKPSTFLDADTEGENVFFLTTSQLSAGDADQLPDVYDARVGGGLSASATAPPPCSGEACRAPALAPAAPLAPGGSATASGPGNVKPRHAGPKKHKKPHRSDKRGKKHHPDQHRKPAGDRKGGRR